MKTTPAQLKAALSALAPVYVLTGDEPLQQQECAEQVLAAAKSQDYQERQILHVDRQFNWQELTFAANSQSLFAARKIVWLRAPNALGREGTSALAAYCQAPPSDTLLLVQMGKIDKKSKSSQWFKAVEKTAVVVEIWPVSAERLPDWLQQRARAMGLNIDRDAVQMLSQKVEGNMLAAAQELQKLQLSHPDVPITTAVVREQVAFHSRYSVFDLLDATLMGGKNHLPRALLILANLRQEGVVPVQILAVLVLELRTLHHMLEQKSRGASEAQYLNSVWSARKNFLAAAVRRLDLPTCAMLLARAARLDQINKGVLAGDSWYELAYIIERMAGLNLKLATAAI